jgi:hypothetical protein
LQTLATIYSPEQAFNVFASGAGAGYWNQAYYAVPIDQEFVAAFQTQVRKAFEQQVNFQGKVELIFNRIFLIAVRP